MFDDSRSQFHCEFSQMCAFVVSIFYALVSFCAALGEAKQMKWHNSVW